MTEMKEAISAEPRLGHDINDAWLELLEKILGQGRQCSPRGRLTKELDQETVLIDMRRPVLVVPARKLSYQYLAAEAHWIISGDDRVETIAPYNKNLAQFSDDGVTFFGAYGPRLVEQLPHVMHALVTDPDTRQAGLTLWRPSPPPTRDVPCTVALFFRVREGRLNCYAFMRSNDAWLGLPYDAFTFSMISHFVAGHLRIVGRRVTPGVLHLTAASSHLYATDWARAQQTLLLAGVGPWPQHEVPEMSPDELMKELEVLRDTRPGDPLRWWEVRT